MHGPMLALLTALVFSPRLGPSARRSFFSRTGFPPREHWASGLIPYPILLTIQIVMLIVMVKISTDVWRGAGFFAHADGRLMPASSSPSA